MDPGETRLTHAAFQSKDEEEAKTCRGPSGGCGIDGHCRAAGDRVRRKDFGWRAWSGRRAAGDACASAGGAVGAHPGYDGVFVGAEVAAIGGHQSAGGRASYKNIREVG